MKSVAQLTPSIEQVQPELIGRAHKIIHQDGNFYKVQSSRDETVEYTVKHDSKKGFTCTCEAGLRAFSRCKLGVCAHVLIALAAAAEERQAVAELQAAITAQAAPVVSSAPTIDVATRSRIEAANERAATKPVSKARGYEVKPFSLLK